MQHKQGEERNQMFMFSLGSAIAPDSFVRFVDAFVDTIDLKSFGFAHVECKEEGCPPYPPAALMKLYLYGYRFRRYIIPDCKACPSRQKCTRGKHNGRTIDRSEFADALEANTKIVKDNPDYYRKRQQIAGHMYGTLKRQWRFTHTNVRGKEKVPGEFGLSFTGYNLIKCISILGAENLISKLRESCLPVIKSKYRLILSVFNEFFYSGKNIVVC